MKISNSLNYFWATDEKNSKIFNFKKLNIGTELAQNRWLQNKSSIKRQTMLSKRKPKTPYQNSDPPKAMACTPNEISLLPFFFFKSNLRLDFGSDLRNVSKGSMTKSIIFGYKFSPRIAVN